MSDISSAQPLENTAASDADGDTVCRLQEEQRIPWAAGDRVMVEGYLRAFAQLSRRPDDVLDLIDHEVLVREGRG